MPHTQPARHRRPWVTAHRESPQSRLLIRERPLRPVRRLISPDFVVGIALVVGWPIALALAVLS